MPVRAPLLTLGLAVIAGCLAAPSSGAQCRLCETPTTGMGDAASGPISLQIEAALDFDRLVLLGFGDGTAELRPDGTHHVSGMVGVLSSRAMVGRARVSGEPGRPVRIDLPSRIELHSASGGRVVIEEIVSDLDSNPRLDRSGALSFRFGGTLRVSGNSEGDYRGEIPITVEYL